MEILERSETLVIFDVYNNEKLWEEWDPGDSKISCRFYTI